MFILRDSLIETDESLREAGKPWSTVQEIDGYVWEKSPNGEVVKERPLKVNDHGMDALRYACVAVNRRWSGGWETSQAALEREKIEAEKRAEEHRDVENEMWWT